MKFVKSYKVEINPTPEQVTTLNKNFGVGRFIYNLFIDTTKDRYTNKLPFMSGYSFSKWLNNEYLPNNEDKSWIKEASSKHVKKIIMNAESAYKRFFKKQAKYPNYKKKNRNNVTFYFVNDNIGKGSQFIIVKRNKIKVPTLGWIRLKEFGYLPVNSIAKSGNISHKAGKYFLSVKVEFEKEINYTPEAEGIGIDLGLKEFATCSNNQVYSNINKTKRIKKLEKQLRRANRGISRKYLANKNRKDKEEWKNYVKQRLKKQKLEQRLINIRTDYINKSIDKLVRTKPAFIAIEDLNISGMMKNKHLSKSLRGQQLYYFRSQIINKCKENGILIHLVSRWYPSSKTCHNCGHINKELELKDRQFVCPSCGMTSDRDFNASLNIRDTKNFVFL